MALEANATEGVQFPEFLDLICAHMTGPDIARTEGLSISRTSKMQKERKQAHTYVLVPGLVSNSRFQCSSNENST